MTIGPLDGPNVPQIKIKPWDHSLEIDQKVTIRGDVMIEPSSEDGELGVLKIDTVNRCVKVSGANLLVLGGTIGTVGPSDIVSGRNIRSEGHIYGDSLSVNRITLSSETITSWADLKVPSIQRFTSPEVPANCSQFYFEGCNLVTGTELPFIQVRETATGKLVQMDVWVNLDEACTGFTLGKPVAEIEPCSTATEAGAWTAIVMN